MLLAKTPGNPSPLFEIGTAEELIKFKTGKKNRMNFAMAFGFPVVHATISCCRAASLQQHPGRSTVKVPMHLFITNVDDGHSTGML